MAQGFDAPNYTQTPNSLFDHMKSMGLSELKCCLAITRATFGWHKSKAQLSITTLEKMTGLSRQGVIEGTARLIERGLVFREYDNDTNTAIYGVNVLDYPPQIEDEVVNVVDYQTPEVVNVVDQGVVNVVDPNKERFNKENNPKKENLSTEKICSPSIDPLIDKYWQYALGQLEHDLSKHTYQRFVMGSLAAGFHDNTLTILCATRNAVDWMNSHLDTTLNKMLPMVSGGKIQRVEFVSGETA